MNNDIGAWKPILVVGKTYQMTTHKYRLTLVGATKIEEALIPNIPPTNFNFKDFSEIHDGKYTPDLLVGNYSLTTPYQLLF
jgi:hypothetical protein